MIPSYLKDLELPLVFSLTPQDVSGCILESSNNEHIVDSETEGRSVFVTQSVGQAEELALKFFAVENSEAQPYALLQIDNGLVKSHDTKKCDCAIANDSYIGFIEFKANAVSLSPLAIKKNYLKAMEQLATTISLFNQHYAPQGKNIQTLRSTVEAFVRVPQGYPRTSSAQINYKVQFAAQNGGIPLSYVNKKKL